MRLLEKIETKMNDDGILIMEPETPSLTTAQANAKLIQQGLTQYKEDKISKCPHKVIQVMPLEEENLKNLEAYIETLAPYGMVVGAIVVSLSIFSFFTYCMSFLFGSITIFIIFLFEMATVVNDS